MEGDYCLFKFKKGTLAYKKVGNGERILFAFHGYGQDHSAFDSLVEELGKRFTIYSFDLFFHGKSEWLEERPISKGEWATLVNELLTQEKVSRFSLLGFSLGAKFVLATLESFKDKIDSMYLIAPDGIKPNIWYTIATGSLAKNYFRSLIKKPNRFHNIMSWAKSLKLVDESVLRFAKSQMDTERKRSQVYHSWVSLSKLNLGRSKIASLITKTAIETTLIAGCRDRIIKPTDLGKLTAQANRIKLIVLEAGHSNVIARSIEVIKKIK